MPYVYLDLPAGMFANGTLHKNRAKWYKGDRVRWRDGAVQPIGGWSMFQVPTGDLAQVVTTPATVKARAGLTYKLNTGSPVYFIGTNAGIKVFTDGDVGVYDITPAGFTPQPAGPLIADGYGDWFYGSSNYGTVRPYTEDNLPVFNWCFRSWGQNLLAASRNDGVLYEWVAPDKTVVAQPLSNAPTGIDCFTVTDQRIVMTAGTGTDPRMITWSDSENNNSWAPASTNQAGFQRLAGNGRFKELVAVRDLILLISETDAHVARYLGPPYIYGFDQVGTDCGAVSGGSVVVTEGFAVWPSKRDFFIFDGAIKKLESPIIDRFIDRYDVANAGKIVGYVNQEFSEIWWLYQSNDSTDDIDSYISWNYQTNAWSDGTLDRTIGFASARLEGPIMVGNDGYLYQHEVHDAQPITADPSEAYIETGPIELGAGDLVSYVKAIQPDFVGGGAVDVYLIGRDRPGGPETTFGPYPIVYPAVGKQPVPTRARGHSVRMRIAGKLGPWSMGSMRIDISAGGKK